MGTKSPTTQSVAGPGGQRSESEHALSNLSLAKFCRDMRVTVRIGSTARRRTNNGSLFGDFAFQKGFLVTERAKIDVPRTRSAPSAQGHASRALRALTKNFQGGRHRQQLTSPTSSASSRRLQTPKTRNLSGNSTVELQYLSRNV